MKFLGYGLLVGLLVTSMAVATGCESMRKHIKSILKVTVVDTEGQPYGYVTVSLVDETGKVAFAEQTNERGMVLFNEIKAGTYSFIVKNVVGNELKVLSPANVKVAVGKTVEVEVKVERASEIPEPQAPRY